MVKKVFAMDSIEFAALTDVGRKREQNEDNFLVDKKLSLYVVWRRHGRTLGGRGGERARRSHRP